MRKRTTYIGTMLKARDAAAVWERKIAARFIVDSLKRAGWSMDPDTWVLMHEKALRNAVGPLGWGLLNGPHGYETFDYVKAEARRRLAGGAP
jgi:hypothetical protein